AQARYQAGVDDHLRYLDAQRNAFSAWLQPRANTDRRFSVLVDENFLADPELDDQANLTFATGGGAYMEVPAIQGGL
ncbi:MAG: hypothetical protein AAB412_01180, partial [Elusimicrobiota bacterium]